MEKHRGWQAQSLNLLSLPSCTAHRLLHGLVPVARRRHLLSASISVSRASHRLALFGATAERGRGRIELQIHTPRTLKIPASRHLLKGQVPGTSAFTMSPSWVLVTAGYRRKGLREASWVHKSQSSQLPLAPAGSSEAAGSNPSPPPRHQPHIKGERPCLPKDRTRGRLSTNWLPLARNTDSRR